MTINLEKHKGDFLIFASIALGTGVLSQKDLATLLNCEVSTKNDKGEWVKTGVWKRHPNLQEHESRSDVSRDGYIGLLFMLMTLEEGQRNKYLDRLIKAGWSRRWTMGDRGSFDYVNIFPLIPLIYACRYGSLVPVPKVPVWLVRKLGGTKGYRGHLTALVILIEMMIGKKSNWQEKMISALIEDAHNPWYFALASRVADADMYTALVTTGHIPDDGYAATGWGSCPNELYKELVAYTLKVEL